MKSIEIKGAKENNLKNIDLSIPRNKLVCFVGVSGSGKSTIAFDIVAKEGQRQYFESLSTLARRYMPKSNRPDVESIKGLSSTIVINQKRVHGSPRSTVGTMTETYTYLRLLYSRCGLPIYDSSYFSFNHPLGACPKCKGLGKEFGVDPRKVLDWDKSLNEGAINHHNWKPGTRHFNILKATGRVDLDKKIRELSEEEIKFLLYSPHIELSSRESNGFIQSYSYEGVITRMLTRTGDSRFKSKEYLQNPLLEYRECSECYGGRLNKKSLEVKINGMNIGEVSNMTLESAYDFVSKVDHKNANEIKPRLLEQLKFMIDSGLGYLSLNRSTDTLSGGEAQRVKLARQLGSDLIETIYVLDEPTAGLHPRDINKVIVGLKKLVENGNSVLVVEHDEQVIRSADYLIEVGPLGGIKGGLIVYQGSLEGMLNCKDSVTAEYMQCRKDKVNEIRRPSGFLKIGDIKRNNLKGVNVNIPLGVLTAVTGVSGAGKSSLIEEVLYRGVENIINIDQSPIGAMKRGCIATYVGAFDNIRKLFAKENRVSESMFSFNSSKGQCPECKGLGFNEIDMNFLGDIKIKCDKCNGKRYRADVLKYLYKSRNVFDVLEMTVDEAIEFFSESENINSSLLLLGEVGLGYITLGQTLDTLSGGESQRLKLASRLTSKGNIYILDEPTTGLHFKDIDMLLKLLNRLVDAGNSVVVVEHNIDVIRSCDWVIDLGPEGGDKGGVILYAGAPTGLRLCKESLTGKFV